MSRQTLWGVMLLVGVALYLWKSGEPAKLKSTRTDGPNLLLVTLDTTRADAIGPEQTPWVHRVGAEGVRFSQAVSTAPITQPAHLGILTGEPPVKSGVVTNGTVIGDRPSMLSHRLQAGGWVTAAFVSAAPLTRKFGWAQGWDHFGDTLKRSLLNPARERPGSETVDEALGWLRRHKRERFAVWLHLFDPHGPYEAPGRALDGPRDGEALDLPSYWPDTHRGITDPQWFVDAYGAEVTEADTQLGRVIEALETWGVLDDTLVVVTADHGESLTEHDYLFDHGDHLYDVSLRVPLVARWPAMIPAGTRVGCSTPTTDIYGAVLSLMGMEDHPAGAVFSGKQSCEDGPVLATTVTERFADPPPIAHAYRTPAHKRVQPASGGAVCFDLVADPGEDNPQAVCPEPVSAAMAASLQAQIPVKAPLTDAETEAELKQLGYLD